MWGVSLSAAPLDGVCYLIVIMPVDFNGLPAVCLKSLGTSSEMQDWFSLRL